MAQKRHYWQYIIDSNGAPVSGGTITLYKAGTSVLAYYFLTATGTTPYTTDTLAITTDTNGYFHFWIADKSDDDTDDYGYEYFQRFRIICTKAGDTLLDIDNIEIMDTQHYEVDVTDTDTVKNKMISNYLGNIWNDHVLEEINVDGVTEVHGIQEVDVSNTSNLKNKLVSNNMAKTWTEGLSGLSGSNYLRKDGTVVLTGNWDIGTYALLAGIIQARSSSGLIIKDYAGNTVATISTSNLSVPVVTISGGTIDGTTITNSTFSGTGATITTASITTLSADVIRTLSAGDMLITDRRGTVAITIENSTGQVVMSLVDINGGTIDGTSIGSSSASTGKFTSLTLTTGSTVTGIVDEIVSTDNTKLTTAAAVVDYTSKIPTVDYVLDLGDDYVLTSVGQTITATCSGSGGGTLTLPSASAGSEGGFLKIFKTTTGLVTVKSRTGDEIAYNDGTAGLATEVSNSDQYTVLELQIISDNLWGVINTIGTWSYS